jgi:hypothetical protein
MFTSKIKHRRATGLPVAFARSSGAALIDAEGRASLSSSI